MDRFSIQNKNIEKLANLGYWEYWPTTSQVLFSDGVNQILDFITPPITTKTIISYLKRTHLTNDYADLLSFFKAIKKGQTNTPKIFSFQMPDHSIRYFEMNAMISQTPSEDYIAGTIKEVTEKTKYRILKEKEVLFERKISEITTRFVSSQNYESTIQSTLNEIGELCQAGVVYLFRIENNFISEEFTWKNTLGKTAINVTASLPPNELKYLIELIKEQKLIYYHQLNEMPEIAEKLQQLLLNKGASSIAISAIRNEKQTIGALVLVRNIPYLKWDFTDIHIIKMTSLLISNTIKQHIIHKHLKNSEKRLQFALLAGNLGTWEYNLNKQQYFFDERFANTFGYSNNTLNRLPNWLKENIHPDDFNQYYNAMMLCLEGNQKFYTIEYRIKAKNGQYKWIHDWSIVTKINNNGEPTMMVGIIQDISEKKSAEQELHKAKEKAEENDKLKSAFLANVSHEIRTPMNGISGFAELLYNNMVSDKEKHQYLEIIWKSSNQLLALINNIIDISKLETNQLKLYNRECSLDSLFDDLNRYFLPVFSKNPHIEFKTVLPTDKLFNYINTDESRLKQILINLINNALNFTTQGYIEVGYQIINNCELKFYVSDTGNGIPQSHQNHLFDRFVQSNPELSINEGGSGLGLPISRGIVELMGGKIWIKSLPGIGSQVYFTIPYLPTRIKLENIN